MSSTELFYSSEEEILEEELLQVRKIRRNLRDNSNPLELDNLTLNKAAFIYILENIEGKLKLNKRQSAVPSVIKLATALRFFAHGSYQISVGNDFTVALAQPTVSQILKDVLKVIGNVLCKKWVQFQYTEEEKRSAMIFFYEKCGIPNITGCIDGTHIRIVAPKRELRHLYYNRKGFYSINAMIVCDHLMKIRYINAKNPGATHDANVWNMSTLRQKIHEDYCNHTNNVVLLGDGGYALTPYLLTPYRNAMEGSSQARFNRKHSQGRNIIERTIGLLKSRFRFLLSARELYYPPEKSTHITNICATLHNICIKYNIESPEIENDIQENDNDEEEVVSINELNDEISNNLVDDGRRIRDRILNSLN